MQKHTLNILYVEPFYSGSHKQWIDSYKRYSNLNIEILSLPGKKWKWRMHGGAITLAKEYNSIKKRYHLILCSDMLNLPVFKSLCYDNLANSKVVMYFHENQLSYPWSPLDQDLELKRDLHYHYINYTSSLISDYNYFNSNYHFNSYIDGLKKYLQKMPDFKNIDTIDLILQKSDILPIGCNTNKKNKYNNKNNIPVILWNHRWEYDKNPDLFFKILFELAESNFQFKLIVVGEKYSDYPKIFDIAKDRLSNQIIHFGYCEDYQDYIKYLEMAHILPVTSNQDFFGISIVEAVSYGAHPILPKRLSYPELFNYELNPNIFYNNKSELKDKIISSINNLDLLLEKTKILAQNTINKFNWSTVSEQYDRAFKDLIN
tara:strand:+ start:4242 stop:5363 length:1122 start_codon:yes stop_codon:yes gene_type:complete